MKKRIAGPIIPTGEIARAEARLLWANSGSARRLTLEYL
jgi:hypothetical protein